MRRAVAVVALILLAAAALHAAPKPASGGVWLAVVQEGRAGHQGGLRPGDHVTSWVCADGEGRELARGRFEDPWTWLDLEVLFAPKGALTIRGDRDGKPFQVTLHEGPWFLLARPELASAVLAVWERARAAKPAAEEDLAALQAAAKAAPAPVRTWLLSEAARLTSDPALREARVEDAVAAAAKDTRRRDWVLDVGAYTARTRGEAELWGRLLDRLLELRRSGHADPLLVARTQIERGLLAWNAGDLDRAGACWREAMEIRETNAPGSSILGASYNNVALIAHRRGELDEAAGWYAKSIALKERLSPGSLDVAMSLVNIGILESYRGNARRAEENYGRALAIQLAQDPAGLATGNTWVNMGVLAFDRGDLEKAEQNYLKGLAIYEAIPGQDMSVAFALTNLGNVQKRRLDLDAARVTHLRAMGIYEANAPGSLYVAGACANLGDLDMARGDLPAAEAWYRKAFAIREAQAPGSYETAYSLINLADVQQAAGNLQAARESLEKAGAIMASIAPRGRFAAKVEYNSGLVSDADGQREQAQAQFSAALAMFREVAPASEELAECAGALARVLKRAGETARALEAYEEAVAALRGQLASLGGGQEAQERVAEKHLWIYTDYIALLLELHQDRRALGIWEEYRGRSLREILGQRRWEFASDLAADVVEKRNRLQARRQQLAETGAQLSPDAGGEAYLAWTRDMAILQADTAELEAQIHAASPRLGALAVRPLSGDAAVVANEPDTVTLAYLVDDARTTVFCIGPGPGQMRAVILPVKRETLDGLARRIRGELLGGGSAAGPLEQAGNALLKPFLQEIGAAQRLLVLPDGPLHRIPFAALRVKGGGESRATHVCTRLPVHTGTSMTLQAQGVTSRADEGAVLPSLALGDPDYGAGAPAPAITLRAALSRDTPLAPLPGTRREVEEMRAILGDSVEVHVGSDATEERVKSRGGNLRILHLAGHGLVDDQRPLDSAIALARPGEGSREDGFLQVWEVFEQVRFQADLVVLSACDTALGKESGGEGIMGLNRAFQVAGARSVLVSLWPISDRGTARFMELFYKALQDGASKDVALQRAQQAMASDPVFASPLYWGAFVLAGDWQ